MKNQTTHKKQNNILGQNASTALLHMIGISKKLIDLANRESHALITGDHFSFGMMQREKEDLAHNYALAAEEFQTRIEEFRNADKGLIAQLDAAQKEIKEKMDNNNVLIAQVKKRAQANTQSTLFSVQELGQRSNQHPAVEKHGE